MLSLVPKKIYLLRRLWLPALWSVLLSIGLWPSVVGGQVPAKVVPPEELRSYFTPPPEWQDCYGDYASPLVFDDGSRVHTKEDWTRRRQQIFNRWQQLLGKWPPVMTEPRVEILESARRDGYSELKVRFHWTPNQLTTGYLLLPDGEPIQRPAVLTVYYEPETAIGQGRPYRDFALQLTRRGFVTLSIGTTEATAAKTYAIYEPSLDEVDVEPLSMLAYAAANAWWVLATRPEVDSERIGVVGHSFGGKWALFASCLYERFACAVWSDPGIVFDNARPNINYWEPWYLGHHPRPWRERGLITDENPARGLYARLMEQSRDLHELHALMAPRPFLVSGGEEDPVERWVPLNHTVAVNKVLGYDYRVAMTNRPQHSPDAQSNEVIYQFFELFLK